MLFEATPSVQGFIAIAKPSLQRPDQIQKTLSEMDGFVQHFAKMLNDRQYFVHFLIRKLNEMANMLDEIVQFGSRFVHFVQRSFKTVKEMRHFVHRFYRMLNGMEHFLDEMAYFVHSSAHFAELFLNRMHLFRHVLRPLDERQAFHPQWAWHSTHSCWETPGNPDFRRFRRELFGKGLVPAVRRPGQRLQQPGLRALFLQP